jgi:hypothetical protein
MHKIKRKILFFLFVAAFLLITPYIILYASGYQIDWGHLFSPLMVQKTGMVIVYSEPAGANIFLNEKKQKSSGLSILPTDNNLKTPAKIKNLLPGSYELKIEMPGYWSWSRRISVNPGQITHVLDVNLFRRELPILIASTPLGEIYPSPSFKKILIGGNNLIDLKSELSENLTASSGLVLWSEDSGKIIIGERIINLKDRSKDIFLSKVIGTKISNLKWAEKNSEQIFYRHKNSLNAFNISQESVSTIVESEDILDYLSKGDGLFYISKNGFSATLKEYSISKKVVKKEINLPPSEGYMFLAGEGKFLNLYDSKYKILYIIDTDSQSSPLLETVSGAKHFQWLDEKKLLFANDSEIWMLDTSDNSRRLLLRWSEQLKGIVKTQNDNYIFFYTEDSLKALTWDKGDEKIQVTELLKLEAINSLFLSDNKNFLYFSGKTGNQEGLYKLNIK